MHTSCHCLSASFSPQLKAELVHCLFLFSFATSPLFPSVTLSLSICTSITLILFRSLFPPLSLFVAILFALLMCAFLSSDVGPLRIDRRCYWEGKGYEEHKKTTIITCTLVNQLLYSFSHMLLPTAIMIRMAN